MAVHNASGPGLLDSLGTALHTRAEVGDDGRIHLTYDAKHELPELPETPLQPQEAPIDRGKPPHPPALNILILIVGSRGAL